MHTHTHSTYKGRTSLDQVYVPFSSPSRDLFALQVLRTQEEQRMMVSTSSRNVTQVRLQGVRRIMCSAQMSSRGTPGMHRGETKTIKAQEFNFTQCSYLFVVVCIALQYMFILLPSCSAHVQPEGALSSAIYSSVDKKSLRKT